MIKVENENSFVYPSKYVLINDDICYSVLTDKLIKIISPEGKR